MTSNLSPARTSNSHAVAAPSLSLSRRAQPSAAASFFAPPLPLLPLPLPRGAAKPDREPIPREADGRVIVTPGVAAQPTRSLPIARLSHSHFAAAASNNGNSDDSDDAVGALQQLTISNSSAHEPWRNGPSHWLPVDPTCGNRHLLLLSPSDPRMASELAAIKARFAVTLPHAVVSTVYRVQQPQQWSAYEMRKREMVRAGQAPNERIVYHGTRKVHPKHIYDSHIGFDPRMGRCGSQVTWFAAAASYSNSLAFEVALAKLNERAMTSMPYNDPNCYVLRHAPPGSRLLFEAQILAGGYSQQVYIGAGEIFTIADSSCMRPTSLIVYI